MRVPYWLQGALAAPAFVGLIFILKVTCPSSELCFADTFLSPIFLPVPLLYKIFGDNPAAVAYEPMLVISYWILVGLLVGLCFDLVKRKDNS